MEIFQQDPRKVEIVFSDFKARRSAMIKALTTEFQQFRKQCDPEKENLCLYGLKNGEWEVREPDEEVPPTMPEPIVGINFARDGMEEKEWVILIANQSDAWLLSVAFFFGSTFTFNQNDRCRLFDMINDLPTVAEIVKVEQERKAAAKSSDDTRSRSQQENNPLRRKASHCEEEGGTFCAACGVKYIPDEFWILCDTCEEWYHGKCVQMTPTKAERITRYKCLACTYGRPHP